MVSSGNRVVAVIVGGLVALGTLAGCSGGGDTSMTAAPTATSEATSTPTESAAVPERYEGADFELSKPLPAELEYLSEASFEEFAAAPKADQLKWKSWAEQYKPEMVAYINSVYPKEANTPYALSLDSDFETVMKDLQATDRLIANLGEGAPETMDDNGALNEERGTKILIAQYAGPNIEIVQNAYNEKFISPLAGQSVNVVQAARGDYFDLLQDTREANDLSARIVTYVYGDGGISKIAYDIEYTDPSGKLHYFDAGVVEFIDFEGNTAYTTFVTG